MFLQEEAVLSALLGLFGLYGAGVTLQDAAQHPNLHLSALLATVITAALSATSAPVYIVMTITALIALHLPTALITQLRAIAVRAPRKHPHPADAATPEQH